MRSLAALPSQNSNKGQLAEEPRTLDRWEALGVGPPRTLVGRQVLYRRASVERWLAAQEQQGGAS
jgi:hypothetical protein